MILKNGSFKYFFDKAIDRTIYCYGIGDFFFRTLENFSEFPWERKLGGLIDGNVKKHGKTIRVNKTSFNIMSIRDFIRVKDDKAIILITAQAYFEIIRELNNYKELDNTECYIYFFMCNLSLGPVDIKRDGPYMIPSTIHYCWFGGNELPDLYKRCIDSWHKFCPNYEIIEWNENNCDLESNIYAKQAYEVKKYGFVPDYFRLKIIYENGGIYLDTDVELLRSLDDLRHEKFFCGMQCPGQVGLGLGFGASFHNTLVKMLMDTYEGLTFINADGSYNEIASPIYQTRELKKLGMKPGNRKQSVLDACIYPTEVLSPINIYVGSKHITNNTYAVHHFDGSWVSKERKERKNQEFERAKEIERMFK